MIVLYLNLSLPGGHAVVLHTSVRCIVPILSSSFDQLLYAYKIDYPTKYGFHTQLIYQVHLQETHQF